MRLNAYFDRIVCINLDRRPDRWVQCVALFSKHGMRVERVAAVDRRELVRDRPDLLHSIPDGSKGCLLSHRHVFEQMLASTDKRILVLEDDVNFVDDLQERFSAASIPLWDMLYLGGTYIRPKKPVPVNRAIARITGGMLTTSHYGITRAMAERALRSTADLKTKMDVTLSRIHPSIEAFTFWPVLAWQRPGYSDIREKHKDYRDIMSRGRSNVTPIKRR